jgi:hypothetical protein
MDGVEILAVAVYVPLLAAAAVVVWRRPVLALYLFVFGLAVHNVVMASLYQAGVRGVALDAIAAWKEILLAVALLAVCVRARGLPFRPQLVDAFALAFGTVVVLYAVLPQSLLGGEASAEGVLQGLRYAVVPVLAYALGRSLGLDTRELHRLGNAVVGVASLLAVGGIVELYTVSLDWWRTSGVPGWYGDQLGFQYHGLSGLPENFVFNTGGGEFERRLVSSFLSPLATSYVLAVALLFVAARPSRWAIALSPLLVAALLLTHSRSTIVALAVSLVVLAAIRRSWWPAVAAPILIGIGVAFLADSGAVAPEGRYTAAELREQGVVASPNAAEAVNDPLALQEPSVSSHLRSLREGFERVGAHPQGYGLGNAGSVAIRTDTPLLAGESTYAEIGVETGVVGLALFLAWNGALLVAVARRGLQSAPAAWLAASLATVLAIGLQTDVLGVPWLAYCLWALAGSAAGLQPEAEPATGRQPAQDDASMEGSAQRAARPAGLRSRLLR